MFLLIISLTFSEKKRSFDEGADNTGITLLILTLLAFIFL